MKLVFQMNERGLKVLSEMVASNANAWPVAAELRAHWLAFDAEAIRRAARLPFVIFDARFADEVWWRAISRNPELTTVTSNDRPAWPAQAGEDLMGELLVFAWHMVRLDHLVARLTLGILPGVGASLTALTPQHIRHIATRHARVLELRWTNDPAFWSRLLIAALNADDRALSDIHLHAQLRLSSALMADAISPLGVGDDGY